LLTFRITTQTDVLPALSMCFEPPESGLLNRPPRNVRTDRLANFRLLLHAYGFLGVLESLCAMSMSVFPSYSPSFVAHDSRFMHAGHSGISRSTAFPSHR
jgi:magnesium-transporting ATPase (P-type)